MPSPWLVERGAYEHGTGEGGRQLHKHALPPGAVADDLQGKLFMERALDRFVHGSMYELVGFLCTLNSLVP